MRAVILAAGRGSRMGRHTDARPKGLAELRGRPLLAWQLAALREAGVRDVAIVRGYRGEALPFEATYFENPRWEATNMVASLACAESWLLEAPVLVAYADLVYAPEVVPLLRAARADVAVAYDPRWLALWRRRFDDPLSDAETFALREDGTLRTIGERPTSVAEVEGQYMGLTRLTPAGARELLSLWRSLDGDARDRMDMTGLFRIALDAGIPIGAVPFDGWWCEVDRPADLEVAAEVVPARALGEPR